MGANTYRLMSAMSTQAAGSEADFSAEEADSVTVAYDPARVTVFPS